MSSYGCLVSGKKTVGGTNFDITKESKAKRIEYHSHKKDPVESMGAPPGPYPVPWEDL